MGDLITIGSAAAAAGVSADTIRYYERLGLIPKPPRTRSGYRIYSPGVIRRLLVVRSAQRFGFSLKEIAAFLAVRERGGRPCHDVRQAAQRRLDAVDRQIVELTSTRERMQKTLRQWDRTLARTPADRPAYLLEALTMPFDVPAQATRSPLVSTRRRSRPPEERRR